jgi:hypothetical protein
MAQWFGVVSTAKNLWVPKTTGNFSLAEQLLAFKELLWSMELVKVKHLLGIFKWNEK